MVSLSELKPVAETLNDKSNSVNEIIADLNATLEKLNVGIEVDDGPILHTSNWTWPEDHANVRTRHVCHLGYAKLGEHWQLAVAEYNEIQEVEDGRPEKDDYGNDETEYGELSSFIPLLQAPRSLRIEALAEVENLFSTLKERAESRIKAIDKARELAAIAKLSAPVTPTVSTSAGIGVDSVVEFNMYYSNTDYYKRRESPDRGWLIQPKGERLQVGKVVDVSRQYLQIAPISGEWAQYLQDRNGKKTPDGFLWAPVASFPGHILRPYVAPPAQELPSTGEATTGK